MESITQYQLSMTKDEAILLTYISHIFAKLVTATIPGRDMGKLLNEAAVLVFETKHVPDEAHKGLIKSLTTLCDQIAVDIELETL